MEHLGTKELETPRLLLRKFTPEDAQAMFQNWASDTQVTKFLMWPTHRRVEDSRSILTNWTKNYGEPGCYLWAVVVKENGPEPIGSIGVNACDDKLRSAHIGYCIGRNWWHMGITSEALRRVMDYLFDEVGMNRVESRHDPRNLHSGAVMKKCGMRYEGTLRQADWNNQGICDACFYSLLASER